MPVNIWMRSNNYLCNNSRVILFQTFQRSKLTTGNYNCHPIPKFLQVRFEGVIESIKETVIIPKLRKNVLCISPLNCLLFDKSFFIITVALREYHGVSNHRQLDCLFNYFSVKNWNMSKSRFSGLSDGNHQYHAISWFRAKRADNAKGVCMLWRHQAVSLVF